MQAAVVEALGACKLAWPCCDYADALCQRGGPGDRERSAVLLDESVAISTELGMPPLMERAQSRRQAIETQPAAPSTYPAGLTQREVEVLRSWPWAGTTGRSPKNWS